VSVNQEGIYITPEGMADIEQRHEGKQALLEQMRREREAQYGQRHSHVGVEIGRGLGDLTLMAHTYRNLAGMANYCAMAGKDDAGRTLASLASGIMRAAVELHGKGAETELLTLTAPATMATDELDLTDDEPTGVAYVSFGFADAMPGATPDEVIEAIRLMSPSYEAGSVEDDGPEPGSSLEAHVSPEPDETPQAKAARTRRANKAKAQAEQASSAATER
jgi:hypothetical protein